MFLQGLFVLGTLFSISAGNSVPLNEPTQPGDLPQPLEITAPQKPELEKPEIAFPAGVKAEGTQLDTQAVVLPKVPESQADTLQRQVITASPAPTAAPHGQVITTPPAEQEIIVDLLPHRATYSITLDKNYQDEDVAEAKGQMTIQLAKVGDGWAIEQKSTLHIYYRDGSAEQVITTLATYESMDGLKYSFNARTVRGDEEESISGEAILASKGGAGIVTYQQPDESTIQLPVGTIFPTHHLIHMLTAAMKGKKVVSNIVFDGSSETHEPVQVDTVFAAAQDPKLALSNKDLLRTKKVWPMRMAIYAVDSTGPEADYEIMQNVLDRGIIRDMTLDYGTFKVKAVLNQVEVFS
ncbi:MAG: EipB family protein [Candidatus Paracaedibacter sp.]